MWATKSGCYQRATEVSQGESRLSSILTRYVTIPFESRLLSQRFPNRATCWQLRRITLSLPQRPLLMGIVNVTPDSFSDGGKFFSTGAAVEHGLRLAAEGADLLDIGGESTRPYSTPVEERKELDRVLPVVEALHSQTDLPLSIDTSKALVAREAVAAGAEIINDVTALTGDPAMLDVALESEAGLCAMHMQGTPQTMQDAPKYEDVTEDIFSYLVAQRERLVAAGIQRERISLDPGIGFGKTHNDNLTLLAHAGRFHELECPLLFGPSRKGFIGKVLGDKSIDPLFGTLGVVLALAAQGVQIIRIHDVGPIHQALQLFETTGGIDGTPRCLK